MYISEELAARFYRFGEASYIQNGEFLQPEHISIGTGVFMRAPFRVEAKNSCGNAGKPVIEIGDGCQINMGLSITSGGGVLLERNVLIDSFVTINERADSGQEETVCSPIHDKLTGGGDRNLVIGAGAWIGANASLAGPLRIGIGSVVKANSVVLDDVPDYCVVAGSPASIIEVYEPASGQWIHVSDEREALECLESRREQPLLSICIPTYNRAGHLDRCLHSIFSQIAGNDLIEVVVSDNASTDRTPEILRTYSSLYPNLRVFRNEANLGADRNIYHVAGLGRGKFIKLQGDDDFYVNDTIMPLLHLLHEHSDCGIVHINVRNGDGQVIIREGMQSYLEATSIYATFITSTLFRRDELENVKVPDLFIDSCFNQLYLQYAILENNPRYCIFNSSMFTYAGLSSNAYNFGRVVFESYQSILRHFVGKGLNPEDISREKRDTLWGYAIPWFKRIIGTGMVADTSGFEDIYTEQYRDEPYYGEMLRIIQTIRNTAQ